VWITADPCQEVPDFLVTSYSPIEWHDFFLGTIGAAAALTGLLFVAISINLEQILKYPDLPGRAAGTLGMLVSGLVVSAFALAPAQGNLTLGVEIAAAGVIVAVQAMWVTRGKGTTDQPQSWRVQHLASLLVPSITFTVGGVSLIAGGGGGLYWVFAGVLLVFVTASINAWVLLVEILR
jgi:modulator of FtsH protease